MDMHRNPWSRAMPGTAGPWIRFQLRRHWRDEQGAAAVELALVLPILLMLLFGIVEFARAWNVRQTLTDAAREATRVAVVHNAMMPAATLDDSVRKVVLHAANRASLDLTKLTITRSGIGTGLTARVELEYEYVPMIGLVLKAPITMRTASVMRNE